MCTAVQGPTKADIGVRSFESYCWFEDLLLTDTLYMHCSFSCDKVHHKNRKYNQNSTHMLNKRLATYNSMSNSKNEGEDGMMRM